jgi:hypothetical protein
LHGNIDQGLGDAFARGRWRDPHGVRCVESRGTSPLFQGAYFDVVIITFGDPAIRAAHRATQAIPIVGMTDDMVGSGLAASMARPGGNTTGVSILAPELPATDAGATNFVRCRHEDGWGGDADHSVQPVHVPTST